MNNPAPSTFVEPTGAAATPTIGKEPGPLDSISWLPCSLTLDLPVVRFTVGNLLKLAAGAIVETASHHTSDVPLRVNDVLIGWTELDVIDDRLAVRFTDQA